MKSTLCEKCNRSISNNNFRMHSNRCDGSIPKEKLILDTDNLNCSFCDKLCKSLNSRTQHQVRCKLNPDKIDMSYLKLTNSRKHNPNGKYRNQWSKAKDLGLVHIESEETKAKRAKSLKESAKIYWEDPANREKQSLAMKKAVQKYPESYREGINRGKVKTYYIDGFTLHGKWEVAFYNLCKSRNIKIIKNEKGFPYNWNGSEHTYYPDFFLEEYNLYIEVKGYETERDTAKWTQFPKKLFVLKAKDIKEIRKGIFDKATLA